MSLSLTHAAAAAGVPQAGSARAVEAVLHSGANLAAKDSDGRNAMHYAALGGVPECVRALRRAGAFHSPDKDGFTPLHVACAAGMAKVRERSAPGGVWCVCFCALSRVCVCACARRGVDAHRTPTPCALLLLLLHVRRCTSYSSPPLT